MKEAIESALDSFIRFGSSPNLPLPETIEQTHRAGGGSSGKGSSKGRDDTITKRSSDGSDGAKKRAPEEPWMSENPDPVKEWLLPEGKNYGDFFATPDQRRGFPPCQTSPIG